MGTSCRDTVASGIYTNDAPTIRFANYMGLRAVLRAPFGCMLTSPLQSRPLVEMDFVRSHGGAGPHLEQLDRDTIRPMHSCVV